MDYIKIVNWKRWQSYRSDRGQPPWIKLHRVLMRNPEWLSLTDAQKGQLVSMWLLAADKKGQIPNNPEVVQRLCFLSKKPDFQLFSDLKFIEGWRQSDAKVTPERRRDDAPETEESRVEESRDSKNRLAQNGFGQFWQAYPRKTARKDAIKAWGQLKPDTDLQEKILDSIAKQKYCAQWLRDNGEAIPYPASFIRGERWNDEVEKVRSAELAEDRGLYQHGWSEEEK